MDGQHFTIRENNVTVATGRITKLYDSLDVPLNSKLAKIPIKIDDLWSATIEKSTYPKYISVYHTVEWQAQIIYFLDALETKQEVESEKKATDIFFTHGGIKSCKEIVLKEDGNWMNFHSMMYVTH